MLVAKAIANTLNRARRHHCLRRQLFRCAIGDPRITSARVDDLAVPLGLEITAAGDIDLDEGASLP